MARSREHFSVWQSFADLAMGLMAVFALVLVILLWQQGQANRLLQREKATSERQRELLVEERKRFAQDLLEVLEESYVLVQSQDGAEEWVRQLFTEQDCLLEMTEDGVLRRTEQSADPAQRGSAAAELYPPGETRLNLDGEAALESCRENFARLAYCLSPDSSLESALAAAPDSMEKLRKTRRSQICSAGTEGDSEVNPEDVPKVNQLRRGVEAVVLEGSTDRVPLQRDTPPVRNAANQPLALEAVSKSFVDNAHLGAERARQALGHLLRLVEPHNEDEADALQVLMSRVRIESPSFGRYQAGPRDLREAGCNDDGPCPAARNLSLRLRWKKAELRRPYNGIRRKFCDLLSDENSSLVQGLRSAGRDPQEWKARFGCKALRETS